MAFESILRMNRKQKSVRGRKAIGGIFVGAFNFQLDTQKAIKSSDNGTNLIVSSLLGYLCDLAVPAEYSTGGHLICCSMT